jgi:hypothetical protein
VECLTVQSRKSDARRVGQTLGPQAVDDHVRHRIPQTLEYLKLYGKPVVHHPLNLVSVCCLKCNDAVNIGHRPLEVEELAYRIRKDIGNG